MDRTFNRVTAYPGDRVKVIESQRLLVALDEDDGRLVRFEAEGRNWLHPREGGRYFCRLTLMGSNGTEQEAWPNQPSVSGTGATATLSANTVLTSEGTELAIQLTCFLEVHDGAAGWVVSVINDAPDVTVTTVVMPQLDGLRLSDDGRADVLYLPFHAGERLPAPAAALADMANGVISGVARGRDRVHRTEEGYSYSLLYNGDASMMWLALSDGEHSLYIASHDPTFPVTQLRVDTLGPADGRIDIALAIWVSVGPGQSWTSAEYVVAAVDGGWQACADRYRTWIDGVLDLTPDRNSLWFRDIPSAWATFLKGQDGQVIRTFKELPAAYDEASASGIRLVTPYGWSTGGFDTQVPEFYPDLELGGPVQMASAFGKVHTAGGQLMTYLNARIMATSSPYLASLGNQWAVRRSDGELCMETYGTREFVVMCPGARGWRELLADFAQSVVDHFGADAIYYDQVASARPHACFASHHEHTNPGQWNMAYRRLLEQALVQCRSTSTAAALSVEGCSDIYSVLAPVQEDVVLLNSGDTFAFTELFRYTFPEVSVVDFVHNPFERPGEVFSLCPNVTPEVARRRAYRAAILGCQLGMIDTITSDEAWWREVQDLVAQRNAAEPWLSRARFRDDLDVAQASPSLVVKTFASRAALEPFVVVGVHNEYQLRDGSVSIRVPARCEPTVERLESGGSLHRVEPRHSPEGLICFDVGIAPLSFWIVSW